MRLPRIHLTRRWKIGLISAGSVLLAFILLVRLVAVPIVRGKLIAVVRDKLHAQLSMGDFSYHFPYTIVARDCVLRAPTAGGSAENLLDVQQLKVTLASVPLGSGPLLIQEISIESPTVHIINTPSGIAQPTTGPAGQSPDAQANSRKLSDILRLRHLEIVDGSFVYEDRAHPDIPQLVWKGINVAVDTAAKGPADYDYSVKGASADLAAFAADGAFNVDDRAASAKSFTLTVTAGTSGEQQLPPQLQQILRQHRVAGQVKISGSFQADARNPADSSAAADILLNDASAYFPEVDTPVDYLQLSAHAIADRNHLALILSNFSAKSGGTTLAARDARIALDRQKWNWTLQGLTGEVQSDGKWPGFVPKSGAADSSLSTWALPRLAPSGAMQFALDLHGPIAAHPDWRRIEGQIILNPRDFSFRPPGTEQIISLMGGPITIVSSANVLAARLDGLSANSGDAAISIASGQVSLDVPHGTWSVENLVGKLNAKPQAAASSMPSDPGRAIGQNSSSFFDISALALSGSADFSADVHGRLDPIDWRKTEGKITLATQNFSIRPPGFAAPVSHVTAGAIVLAGQTLTATDLQAQYGPDSWTIKSGTFSLTDFTRQKLGLTNLNTAFVFRPNAPAYPKPLADVLDQLHPIGEFHISGDVAADFSSPNPLVNGDLRISGDLASVFMPSQDLHVNDINLTAAMVGDLLQINQLQCSILGGRADISGKIGANAPYAYSAKIAATGVQMAAVSEWLKMSAGGRPQFTGNMDANVLAHGGLMIGGNASNNPSRVIQDLLVADGQIEVDKGNFWDSPAIAQIARTVSISREALTAGQAAAIFHAENRIVHLSNAAVSAPVLGIVGSGTVDFDGNMDMRCVAAPLADWRAKLKGTGIPIIGDVISDIAGGVQSILNDAGSKLVYQIRVTGKTSDPQVKTEPAPLITDAVTKVFTNMMSQKDQNRPIDLLGGKQQSQ